MRRTISRTIIAAVALMSAMSIPTYAEELEYMGDFKITSYCPGSCCNGKWGGVTASGAEPVAGETIAVDPDLIPYGTKVYIEDVGYRIAQDTGGFAKKNSYQIDLLQETHQAAKEWGVQNKKVYIVKD